MSWTKLGAEWPDEARDLSDAAYRLHVDALCYSNRLLADLLINKRELSRISWVDNPDAVVKELLEAGWWEDRGQKWWIGARFGSWQRSREQVLAKRSRDEKAQRRHRLHENGDHSECLKSCPDSPVALSAHDTARDTAHDGVSAHDQAPESARSSERNGTASVKEGRSTEVERNDQPQPLAVVPAGLVDDEDKCPECQYVWGRHRGSCSRRSTA